jgi:hypothetical protein
MNTIRGGHTATLLSDGSVLATGGYLGDEIVDSFSLASAELYDPKSGEWSPAEDMWGGGRAFHQAILLPSGKVLVVGGTEWASADAGFQSAIIYDPAAKTWSPTAAMAIGRYFFTAARLTDGRALVTGGTVTAWPATAMPSQYTLTKTSEIFAE